jgi:hypothetical protein
LSGKAEVRHPVVGWTLRPVGGPTDFNDVRSTAKVWLFGVVVVPACRAMSSCRIAVSPEVLVTRTRRFSVTGTSFSMTFAVSPDFNASALSRFAVPA